MTPEFERLLRFAPVPLRGQSASTWAYDRAAIRLAIAAALGGEPPLDLRRPPTHPEYALSLSHTEGEGAWVAAAHPWRVGLDIEVAARVTAQIIARIAPPAEIARAPNPRYLWCAKEAAFKALAPHGPRTIGTLEILNWRSLTAGYIFNAAAGEGWLVDGGTRLYALYLVPN